MFAKSFCINGWISDLKYLEFIGTPNPNNIMDLNKFFVIKDGALIDENETLIKIIEASKKFISEHNKQTETIIEAINIVFDKSISSSGEIFMSFGAVLNKTVMEMNADADNYNYLYNLIRAFLIRNSKGNNSIFVWKRRGKNVGMYRRHDLKDVR